MTSVGQGPNDRRWETGEWETGNGCAFVASASQAGVATATAVENNGPKPSERAVGVVKNVKSGG